MKGIVFYISCSSLAAVLLSTTWADKQADGFPAYMIPAIPDSTKPDLIYPLQDREGDFVTDRPDNPFYLDDPAAIKKSVEYDPDSDQYIIRETIDGRDVRPPTYITFEEYLEYQKEESEKEYWQERTEAITLVEKEGIIPKLYLNKGGNFFNKFCGPGNSTIDIKPQGNVDVTFGVNYQKIDNPILTEQQRKQGGFDFDMNINMSVVGSICDKIKINLDYNTLATFDFENQIKLKYEGEEDDIIKEIEAGNVTLPLTTSLITGAQSLFGLKTKLQFGRLTATTVYSQQKSQSGNVQVQNGAQIQQYEVFADQYDENRHFFLTHFFRDSYNAAMDEPPIIQSLITITRIEVWKTNRTGATQNTRDIVGLMDLAERNQIFRDDVVIPQGNDARPGNNTNNLYGLLTDLPTYREINNISSRLNSLGLVGVQDYEKVFARKLQPSEYTFNTQLGYISLNQALYPDEVLAVAFEYTFNGQVYKVGEFAQDVPPDSTTASKVLYLKLLKASSVRPVLPIWDLMMKNIYSLGAFQINAEDFQMNLLYQDPGGGQKRYIPESSLRGVPLIRVLGMDYLNKQLDPQPDGIFDFIPGVTINPTNGRIIFPVVEPFGSDLRKKFQPGEENLSDKYVYQQLYDSIKVVAQQYPELNRYVLKGTYKSSISSEISLGAFNVPQGSVVVTAGGNRLIEGQDYTVDYSLGRVKILNEGVLNSGTPVNVSFENNALFGFQIKTLFGTRLDYRVSDKFNIGYTFMRLKERPFTQKVNIGDDPIKNSIWGTDFSYSTESEFLTRIVDKIPLLEAKEKSSLSISAEMARLKPGHPKAIGEDGIVYIDDFEGTRSSYLLNFPTTNWRISSTPAGALNRQGQVLFPEATRLNDFTYGYNRARIAWYNIDPLFLRNNASTPDNIKDNDDEQKNHYAREIFQQEVFPNRSPQQANINQNILTFDMTYYPFERGPYNFESSPNPTAGVSAGVNPDGTLKEPETRWGGIMRNIDNTNFEEANIEFIEFWVLDPFIYNPTSSGGDLYINLGNVSEDVLKDSRYFFENGLPGPNTLADFDSTTWGRVPNVQPIVNAFSNDPDDRAAQDVGFDGLDNSLEASRFDQVLADLQSFLNPDAFASIQADPSSDDYRYYRDGFYDDVSAGILERYRKFNNPQGNSPTNTGGDFASAQTNIPDSEDFNRDNALNESEEYFQYRIRLEPNMEVGENYITNKLEVQASNGNTTDPVTWYQFKIPINNYDAKVGNIPDFKAIRFIRMYLTDFEDQVTLRFATLELVRNQWRRYLQTLREPGEYIPSDEFDNTYFNVTAVNIEENSEKQPFNYVLPPGILREQNPANTQNQIQQLNEQSLAVQVCGLEDGDSRGVTKNVNLDMRTYERIKMFVHGESVLDEIPVESGEVKLFMRLGSDFTQNYYEYEWPLVVSTGDVGKDEEKIWPWENALDLKLDSIIEVKKLRNRLGASSATPFTILDSRGNKITIVGTPDLGLVKSMMLGVRNPKAVGETSDDGLTKCVEVWFNELRLVGLLEDGGWAALGRVEAQLSDFANLAFSANMHTVGFGQLEQQVQERYRDDYYQYDVAGTFQLGKFFPKKWNVQLPMYGGISQNFSTPQFDPYLLDIETKDIVATLVGDEKKDYRKQVQTRNTIKSLNFTNIRFGGQSKQVRFYSPTNFNWTYAFTEQLRSDPLMEADLLRKHRASMAYSFSPKTKYFTPFSKLIKTKTKWFDLIKDINFNLMPSNLSFGTDFNRQFGETKLRSIGDEDFPIEATYNKFLTWDRFYGFKYNPFKSLALDFTATNNARIDEPNGLIDTKEERDSIWTNIKKFGRTTRYTHSANASYTLPIDKLPLFDWVQLKTGYGSSYTWIAAPLSRDSTGRNIPNPLGNNISNSQDIRANADLNFKNIYNKWKFLKPYNAATKRETKEDREKKIAANETRLEKIAKDIEKLKEENKKLKADIPEIKAGDEEEALKKEEVKKKKDAVKKNRQRIKKLRQDRKKVQNPANPTLSPLIRPLISIKRVSVNYTESYSTFLPGYLPKTRFLGQDKGFDTPGADFIFGLQPNRAKLDEYAQRGFMTADTNLNFQFQQTISRNLSVKGTLEPFEDFRVDLTATRTLSENYTEFFKKPSPESPFLHLNPITTGTYTVTFAALKTFFQATDKDGFSEAFAQFSANRRVLSNRFADQNENSIGDFTPPSVDTTNADYSGFRQGYGPYSQDVLIASFLAAYTGKDANEIRLNPFKTIPIPNWRISYTGLSKIKGVDKVFSNINITHGYNSTMTISSYISELNYRGDGYLNPSRIDTITNNFYSQYDVPTIIISEQFAPLIGVDMTFKNNITAKFEYKMSRSLSMSFIDYRLADSRTSEFTIGAGYRLKGIKLPIKFRGKKVQLNNDINFKFDVSFRDNYTYNYTLDQDIQQPTAGMKTIRVAPSIDYVISKRLNIRIFFDRNRSIPRISTSYPITNTRAGVTLRFSLTE